MLIEELVGLGVESVRHGVPNHLVDSDCGPCARPVPGIAQAHEENGAAVDGCQVNGAAERDRDARLKVEPVKRVDDVDVRTVGGPDRAVGLWQVHAEPGELAVVRLREPVGGEWAR